MSTTPVQPTDYDVMRRLRSWEEHAERVGRETVDARLDLWRGRIDALRIQAHLAGLDAEDLLGGPIGRLEQRLDRARERLVTLARETNDVWTALELSFESAAEDLAAGRSLAASATRDE